MVCQLHVFKIRVFKLKDKQLDEECDEEMFYEDGNTDQGNELEADYSKPQDQPAQMAQH